MLLNVVTKLIIPFASLVLVYILKPYFYEKTTAKERENIYFYVRVAVQAAEQIFDYNHAGKDKKQYVLEYLQEKNLNISEDDLDIMIESTVQELNTIKEK